MLRQPACGKREPDLGRGTFQLGRIISSDAMDGGFDHIGQVVHHYEEAVGSRGNDEARGEPASQGGLKGQDWRPCRLHFPGSRRRKGGGE